MRWPGPRRASGGLILCHRQRPYLFQDDNGPGGGAVYRMRLCQIAPDRLELETENVSAIRLLLVPLFEPRALRALYTVERGQGGAWTY